MRYKVTENAETRYVINARYSEGEIVETEDGTLGVVSEVRTEGEFEGPDGETYNPSEDSPVYIIATESDDTPSMAVRASELKQSELPEVDVENPEEDIASNCMAANQDGFFEWPQSWVESETPARVIALKAWVGMGGRHTGCVREMRGNISRPNAFCADFKDRILGWEGWRQGG
jgi:hypothetical protein